MNLDSIKSILTLRYDYTQIPILPILKWEDIEKKENYTTEEINKHLISSLKNQIQI